tara:strand:+ start:1919 stop:3190 length:1272 start_codon:yes stop_codon:yes gene_type:complete
MYQFKLYIIFILSLVLGPTFSQNKGFYDNEEFKRKRHELNFGIGLSTCQSDVGGSQYSEQELSQRFGGTIFRSIYDTDISKSNFVLNAAYIYHFKNRINFRGNLIFSRLSGDDKQAPEFFRNNRSLNFRTDVLELSSVVEFYLKRPTTGNKFNLKNVKGKKLASNVLASWGIYLSGGVGGFLFNPMAKNNFKYPNVVENNGFSPNKKTIYHKLRPLHTEGQGYDGQSLGDNFNVPGKVFKAGKTYKPVAICIPLGLGIVKAFNSDMGIKAELGIRYTFTDYIDDVSGLYYDKSLLAQFNDNGNIAATMSGTGSGDADPLNNSNVGLNDPMEPGTYRYVGYAPVDPSTGNVIYPEDVMIDPDIPGENTYYIDKTHTQVGFRRGNPDNNDYYAFLNVSFYKKFSTHGKVYKSIHSKERRKIKASF